MLGLIATFCFLCLKFICLVVVCTWVLVVDCWVLRHAFLVFFYCSVLLLWIAYFGLIRVVTCWVSWLVLFVCVG